MELFGAKLQYEAAMKYYKGVPKQGYGRNRSKAFKLFKEAASTGLVEAMIQLSEMYSAGEGCRMNYDEALKWMEKAASKGNAEAQYRVGRHYLNKRDYNSGCDYLEKAAQQGHKEAIFALGEYYVLGPFASGTLNEAIEWLSKPALSNDPHAIYLLATAYEHKEKHEYQFEHPFFDCIEDIDMKENYDAYYKNVENSFKPSQNVYKLYEKALRLYEEKASFGSWESATEAARMYLYGIGCDMNKEKAFDYYCRLASQQEGMPNGECCEYYRQKAIINLAKMYELGIGCEKNIDKYKELIQKYEIDEEWFKSYVL